MKIETVEQLRQHYPDPKGLPEQKVIDHLDQHCRKIIELSPFAVVAAGNGKGGADISPKGDPAGFVSVIDSKTLILPDRRGNNRLDLMTHMLDHPTIAILFFVPGMAETLRVYGTVEIRDDLELREQYIDRNMVPATVIIIHVNRAFLHCGRALTRADLWGDTYRIDRKILPNLNQMVRDQIAEKAEK